MVAHANFLAWSSLHCLVSALSSPCVITSPPLSVFFLFAFCVSGNASWTYSCEFFWYPTIPILTEIWREPLEPGVAPISPDDWPSVQAKSLPRVSIYTSTHSLLFCVGLDRQAPTVCVYAVIWLMYYAFIHWYTRSVVTVSRFMCLSIHRVLVRLYFCTASTCSGSSQGSCTWKIQMFSFVHVFIFTF